jgi:hypothetical protein
VADAADTQGRVSAQVEVFALLVLDAVSKFAQEGNWSTPRFPSFEVGSLGNDRLKVYKAFDSCTELCETAQNLPLILLIPHAQTRGRMQFGLMQFEAEVLRSNLRNLLCLRTSAV